MKYFSINNVVVSILFIVLIAPFCNSQTKESTVKLYPRTIDFLNDSEWKVNSVALIKEEGDTYIRIKKIIDPETKKRIRREKTIWAIEYNGDKYFNLGYSGDLNNWGLFLKFDIIGKYCVYIVDKNTPAIVKNSGIFYGGGLTGVLIGESTKWNKNWKDVNGDKKKLLFIDTTKLSKERDNSRNAYCSLANFLTKKQLKEIIKNKHPYTDVKTLSFEEVIKIIEDLNI